MAYNQPHTFVVPYLDLVCCTDHSLTGRRTMSMSPMVYVLLQVGKSQNQESTLARHHRLLTVYSICKKQRCETGLDAVYKPHPPRHIVIYHESRQQPDPMHYDEQADIHLRMRLNELSEGVCVYNVDEPMSK